MGYINIIVQKQPNKFIQIWGECENQKNHLYRIFYLTDRFAFFQ